MALAATGRLLAESGAPDVAARYFERALAVDPAHAEAQRGLAAVGALAEPTAAAALADVGARREAGLLLVAAGHWPEGTAALLAVLREQPDDVAALVGAAEGFARRGLCRSARPLLARAVARRPGNAGIAFALGEVCVRLGAADPAAHAEAARHFAAAAEGMPEDPRAHHAAAKSLAAIGSLAEAETHYAAALATGPPSVDLACDLGLHRARRGDLVGAVEAYRAGLAAHAGDPRLEANLMLALYRAGYEQEPRAIEQRLAARADLPPAVRTLVDACRGDRE